MTTTTMIDGDAGPIAVHELAGDCDADEVLLIAHATGFLGRVYSAFARELAGRVRVVALDFRAHGDSAAPASPDDFSWLGMADDLHATVEHLAASTLHGFGHSMGGAALLEVERRHPGTFSSIFVFEPIVPPEQFSDTGESPLSQAALGRLRTFPSRSDALQRYASKPPLGLFRADVLNDYVTHGFAEIDDGVTLKCLPESESATFTHAGEINLDLLAEIELSVVVGKSGDGGMPAQLADAVANRLPHGQLRTFPTITHFGPLQDPVTIAQCMVEVMDASMS